MDRALQTLPPATDAIVACGLSHAGLVQPENQDSWLTDPAIGLALVADGVGGHRDGAAASQSVVASIAAHLQSVFACGLSADVDAAARLVRENHVRRAVALAHERLAAANVQAGGGDRPSGATVAGIWAPFGAASFVTVFHVGDSRVYRLREGALGQLTRDHSAYEQWRSSGSIGAPPPQKYILQALGVSERVRPDIHSFAPRPGDRLMACTDGVCGLIENGEIAGILGRPGSHESLCETFLAVCLDRGARDNLTAIICDLHS